MIKIIKQKIYNFLRQSEKYTKTDMVYLFKGGSWLTAGKIISSLSSFALAIAFANLLPKETYGLYKYILSIVAILSIPTLSGMDTVLAMAVSRGNEKSVYSALKTKIKWGLLGGLSSLILAVYYFLNQNNDIGINLLIAAIFLPFMDSFSIYGSYLTGRKKFKYQAKCLSLIKIIAVPAMILTIFMTNNIFLVIGIYFSSYTLLRAIFLIITLNKFKPNEKISKGMISYGKHLSLINILGTISAQIDRILVFHFLGAIQLAVYSFAIAIPEQVKGVLKNIETLILPKFSQKNKHETKKAIESKFFKLILIMSFLIIVYIVTAPYIYRIFFPQYIDSILMSQVFSISMIRFAFVPFSVALKTQKKIKAQYIIRAINSIIQIFLMIILITIWGLMGLIISRVLIQIIGNLVNIFFYYRTFNDNSANTDPANSPN